MRPSTRLLIVLCGVIAAACADATSPSPAPLKPTTPALDVIDSSMCRSGYNVSNRTCNAPL